MLCAIDAQAQSIPWADAEAERDAVLSFVAASALDEVAQPRMPRATGYYSNVPEGAPPLYALLNSPDQAGRVVAAMPGVLVHLGALLADNASNAIEQELRLMASAAVLEAMWGCSGRSEWLISAGSRAVPIELNGTGHGAIRDCQVRIGSRRVAFARVWRGASVTYVFGNDDRVRAAQCVANGCDVSTFTVVTIENASEIAERLLEIRHASGAWTIEPLGIRCPLALYLGARFCAI